jgi:hypothetical protein
MRGLDQVSANAAVGLREPQHLASAAFAAMDRLGNAASKMMTTCA